MHKRNILFPIIFVFILNLLFYPTHVKASSSIVMDLDSKRILYSKDINSKQLIASTTKIMTAVIALENLSLTQEITIGEEVIKMYGTSIYITVGEKMTVKDLLYGLLLRSGNDAAVVLAKAVAGNEESFAQLMNKKAQAIGMKNTTFSNSHGLDDETKNYSTAYDMALLSAYAYQNPTYREIVKTKKYRTKTKNKSYLWYNRNKLLSSYEYCTGGKNGYTPSAGKTLVTTASKDNLNLTIVTLDDPNEYDTHEYLYNKAFKNFKNYELISKDNFSIDKNFYEGDCYLKNSFTYPLTKNELKNIKTILTIENKKSQNKIIGQIKIYLKDTQIGELNIYRQPEKKKTDSLLTKFKKLFIS